MKEQEFLRGVVAEHRPVKTFALFSGGHDSICSTHLAMESGVADAVVHVNTGIGIPQTRVPWPGVPSRPISLAQRALPEQTCSGNENQSHR